MLPSRFKLFLHLIDLSMLYLTELLQQTMFHSFMTYVERENANINGIIMHVYSKVSPI